MRNTGALGFRFSSGSLAPPAPTLREVELPLPSLAVRSCHISKTSDDHEGDTESRKRLVNLIAQMCARRAASFDFTIRSARTCARSRRLE
jgi:hypothetical protein